MMKIDFFSFSNFFLLSITFFSLWKKFKVLFISNDWKDWMWKKIWEKIFTSKARSLFSSASYEHTLSRMGMKILYSQSMEFSNKFSSHFVPYMKVLVMKWDESIFRFFSFGVAHVEEFFYNIFYCDNKQ